MDPDSVRVKTVLNQVETADRLGRIAGDIESGAAEVLSRHSVEWDLD